MAIFAAVTLILSIALIVVWKRWRQAARADYIRSYILPPGIYQKLQARRPELTLKECQLIAHALRQFFLAYLKSGCKFVSMPSQAADDLWHELILYTRHYEEFCNHAFGRFLHHTPAVVLGKDKQNNTGLRRVWWHTCLEENINPRKPTRLPLLFALDAKLNISDGYTYTPNCTALRDNRNDRGNTGTAYCGGDFADSSYDGSTDGFGDSSAGDGGGGDGGGGCGGGCGGGD
ncbi:MAG TPA: hypothetical protein VFW53_04035 [Gallionella sp.]|nr:hypothetical protein [Gallionella sp.]